MKFNKKLLVFSLPVLAIALTSAALLTYFVMFQTQVTVSSVIKVDGLGDTILEHEIPEEAPGGEQFCFLHKVVNDASVNIDLSLISDCWYNDDMEDCELGGIDVTLHSIPETSVLEFCAKDEDWKCTKGAYASFEYKNVNPTFSGVLNTYYLDSETEYALVYYPDDDPKFESWGGVGGLVLATWTGDAVDLEIDEELNSNLPFASDWNAGHPVPDYCSYHNGYDDYENCAGAKLWIVRTADLTGGDSMPLVNWNPSKWLFETNLITYSDCDFEEGLGFNVYMDKSNALEFLNTKTKSMTPVLVCYDFDLLIKPGEYLIESQLLPATV